jgi:hypothetical protein
LPVARLKTDPDISQREPFDRSLEEWRRLGAPPDLYDEAAAAAAERQQCAPQYTMDGLSGQQQVQRLLARRWWHWRRPQFLAEVGALTAAESERLQRWPKLHARPAGFYREG